MARGPMELEVVLAATQVGLSGCVYDTPIPDNPPPIRST